MDLACSFVSNVQHMNECSDGNSPVILSIRVIIELLNLIKDVHGVEGLGSDNDGH